MFIHSERVPRLYKIASKCLKEIIENGSSLKELVYNQKFPNLKSLYALLAKSLQHFSEINQIIDKSELLVNEPRFNPWLARVLVTQLFWSNKGLEGSCKPVATILSYRAAMENQKLNKNHERTVTKVTKPRYVRVNTLAIGLDEALSGFCNEGWELVHFKGESYDDFIATVNALNSNQFMVDVHIKELFVFPPKTEFHNHDAYRCKSIILQDKASCLPVHLLNASPGSTVLDMCAAPGMKTTFLAARLNNKGLVFAVENNSKRYQTMNTVIEGTYATCIKTIHKDALLVTPEQCPNLEYILVDPSCTGSGITDRLTIDNEVEEADQTRLSKLSYFQTLLLKHALKNFPQAKRVVYSTCSTYAEENECVVDEVLKSNVNFKLVSADKLLDFPFHKPKQLGDHLDYIRSCCVRTSTDNDLTNGFFIAVFERNDDHLHSDINENLEKKRKKKNAIDSENIEINTRSKLPSTKSKDKRNNIEIVDTQNQTINDLQFNERTEEKPKRKKEIKIPILECESTKKTASLETNVHIYSDNKKNKKSKVKHETPKQETLTNNIIQSVKKTKKNKAVAIIASDASNANIEVIENFERTDRGVKQEKLETDCKMEKNVGVKKSKKKHRRLSERNEQDVEEGATFYKTDESCKKVSEYSNTDVEVDVKKNKKKRRFSEYNEQDFEESVRFHKTNESQNLERTDREVTQEKQETDYKMEENVDIKKSKKKRRRFSEHNEQDVASQYSNTDIRVTQNFERIDREVTQEKQETDYKMEENVHVKKGKKKRRRFSEHNEQGIASECSNSDMGVTQNFERTDEEVRQEKQETDYKMEENLDFKKGKKKRRRFSEHNEHGVASEYSNTNMGVTQNFERTDREVKQKKQETDYKMEENVDVKKSRKSRRRFSEHNEQGIASEYSNSDMGVTQNFERIDGEVRQEKQETDYIMEENVDVQKSKKKRRRFSEHNEHGVASDYSCYTDIGVTEIFERTDREVKQKKQETNYKIEENVDAKKGKKKRRFSEHDEQRVEEGTTYHKTHRSEKVGDYNPDCIENGDEPKKNNSSHIELLIETKIKNPKRGISVDYSKVDDPLLSVKNDNEVKTQKKRKKKTQEI